MAKRKNGPNEVLVGVITPIQWDGDQVIEVALFATDDEEYRIENSHKFFELIQENIEATGNVQRSRKSFRTINIKKYKIL